MALHSHLVRQEWKDIWYLSPENVSAQGWILSKVFGKYFRHFWRPILFFLMCQNTEQNVTNNTSSFKSNGNSDPSYFQTHMPSASLSFPLICPFITTIYKPLRNTNHFDKGFIIPEEYSKTITNESWRPWIRTSGVQENMKFC